MRTDQTGEMMRTGGDVGETLIEILFTIVIIGLTFTSLFTSLATTGTAGNAQRISVQADVVMRNYAEAIKSATQTCVAGVPYTVSYPAPPTGFSPSGTGSTCPSPAGATQLLTLTVAVPSGPPVTMQITVTTP